jgi:hypothetical protein
MKTFRHMLLLGWALLGVVVLVIFAEPELAARVLHPIVSYFPLIPGFLLLATVVYGLIRRYQAGMSRSSSKLV